MVRNAFDVSPMIYYLKQAGPLGKRFPNGVSSRNEGVTVHQSEI